MKTLDTIRTDYEGNRIPETYCVNEAGEGLFVESNGEYRQITGTCQFYATSPQQLIRKLRTRLSPDETIKMVRNSAAGV